jgi:hypothetical protein
VGESLLDTQLTLVADLVVLATGMVPNTTADLNLQYRLGDWSARDWNTIFPIPISSASPMKQGEPEFLQQVQCGLPWIWR